MSQLRASHATALVYAGFWIRLWATVIDSILVVCVLWPLMLLIPGAVTTHAAQLVLGQATMAYTSVDLQLAWPLQALMTWVLPAAIIILFWFLRSATPGKMLVSARIVDADTGSRASKKQLFGRYCGYFVSTLPLGLGFLWAAFDGRKQGWHDKLAGTVVVRTMRDTSAHFAAAGGKNG